MAQTPRGTLTLRSANSEDAVALDHRIYYVAGVRAFHDAMRGVGRRSSSGEDGLVSLATALAVLESARDGQAVAVRFDA
jgi:1,5-anhydro-D-fructose reductase (1,5-anhydro-D-mannitol-forming)